MKLTIKNFVENLEIDLTKNTTISGYNDIGKTFILKVIYTAERMLEFIDNYNSSQARVILNSTSINDINFITRWTW